MLTGNYNIEPIHWNEHRILYKEVQDLKEINPSLCTILSIGGNDFNNPKDPDMGQYTYKLFSEMISTPENRKSFIDSVIEYALEYNFDGIDLHWPHVGDLTREGKPEDFVNFKKLLEECHKSFQQTTPPLILTYASPATIPQNVCEPYQSSPSLYFKWLGECAPFLDRFNVMAYDYDTSWDSPKITRAIAPLYQNTVPGERFYIEETIDNYIKGEVPSSKIVLGIANYGRSYQGVENLSTYDNGPGKPFTTLGDPGPSSGEAGLLSYFEISDAIESGDLIFGVDANTNTSYGYSLSSDEWASFDTPYNTALKTQFAMDNHLLGCFFWTVNQEEYWHEPTYLNIYTAYARFYPYSPS
jgi:chitinase